MAGQKNNDVCSALLLAAAGGDLAGVVRSLKNGAPVDVRNDREETRGMTPLMLAAEGGRLDVVEALLAAGADVNASDDPGGKPDPGLRFVLREAGLDELNRAKYRLNRTPLIFSAIGGHANVVSALLARGAKVNHKDYASCTALHVAARQGRHEVIRTLLAAGAKIDQRGPNGQTAISLAAENGSSDAANVLLEAGASVALPDSEGRSALDVAAVCGRANVVPLLLAALADAPEKSEALNRALTYAVWGNREATEESILSVAEQLVAAGARVVDPGERDQAPLQNAAMSGFERVAALLLNAGAEVDATNGFGSSALLSAVIFHHPAVARLLLEHGANPDLLDNDRKSVAEYARERAEARGDNSMVLLLNQYAKPSERRTGRPKGNTGRQR